MLFQTEVEALRSNTSKFLNKVYIWSAWSSSWTKEVIGQVKFGRVRGNVVYVVLLDSAKFSPVPKRDLITLYAVNTNTLVLRSIKQY